MMQLAGHIIDQILGCTDLHASQIVHIVYSLPCVPAPIERLYLGRSPVVMGDRCILHPLLDDGEETIARLKAPPPSLYGDGSLCGIKECLVLLMTPPGRLNGACGHKLFIIHDQQRGTAVDQFDIYSIYY